MSDRPKPPFRLLPLLTPDTIDSVVKEFVRLLDAETEAGNGGSRADGGSTPALGVIK